MFGVSEKVSPMQNNKPTLSYERDLAVRHQPDVLVVGGGPAGIAAALAVARQGVSVRLIESHSCLGGMVRREWFPLLCSLPTA